MICARIPTPSAKCLIAGAMVGIVASFPKPATAKQNIREAFFAVYPSAVGSPIETVASNSNHCGVCHYDFTGGGSRNPYGVVLETALEGFPSNPSGRQQAVESIELLDSDTDGFDTLTEVTDTLNFSNTPTFPGLTPGNVGNVSNVSVSEIQDFLVPSTGGDSTPPSVTVIAPNGGELLVGNGMAQVDWTASDASGIASISIYYSGDEGANFTPIALGLSNTGSYTWFPANRPSEDAMIRVTAIDNAFNEASDESDNSFDVVSPPGGRVPTTLRDFDQPGSQPFESGTLNDPSACSVCHGNYDSSVEPYFNWAGSMMAQASRDILFEASMVIANQDAPDSGDMCLRCHLPRGWLQGRSVPTDGSQMLQEDMSGVSCDLCHRLVDPFFDPGANPAVDEEILDGIALPPANFANGMYVVDPTGARRGPFVDATTGHPILVSPFHREAAICGTCHDVSNPAFENDGAGNFVANNFDEPATNFSSHTLMAVERTYSEWFYSEYNSPMGVFAPQFGGNLDNVGSCQDCHMRDVTGAGCLLPGAPIRDDLPLHDMTGGSTWLPGLLGQMFPGEVDEQALSAGIDRARYMVQNAATLMVEQIGSEVEITVTNETGHKLPTGYPEGRRMWINIRFLDDAMTLISESGAYDPATGILTQDAEAKVYEVKPGVDAALAPIVNLPEGPSFHFVLSNKIFKDNRIPPRGFDNNNYALFGGSPVGVTYADGQYWDTTTYTIPPGATSVDVTLYYQSTSKEFVEFLRDENTTDTKGQELYDLWNDNGKCPPEEMRTMSLPLADTCGNTICGSAENQCTCPSDCGTPPVIETGLCGDGVDNDCDGDSDCDDLECLGEPGCPECFTDEHCVDDLFCNGSESCNSGSCLPGTDPCPGQLCDEANDTCADCLVDADCSDQNTCTDDSCDMGSCSYTNNSSACNDGDPCTENDSCNGGTCSGTPIPDCGTCVDASDCNDDNPCTDDLCPAGTCVYVDNAIGCDDDNVCTTDDTCSNGVCQGLDTSAEDCDDVNACTQDTCDPVTGCDNNDVTPTGMCCDPLNGALTPIDDDLACTDDSCNTDGTVDHVDNCPPGTVCDPTLGACFEPVLASFQGTGLFELNVEISGGQDQTYALLVTGDSADPTVACVSQFVQPDGTLGSDPVALTTSEWGNSITLVDPDIIPGAAFTLTLQGYLPPAPLPASTWPWGDVNGTLAVNFEDIQIVVFGFQGTFVVPLEDMDLEPCEGNGTINFADIQRDVQAFQGWTFEQTGCPVPCNPGSI